MSGKLGSLGFVAVGKSLADKIVVAPGYSVQVIYALGDPLKSSTAAFRNDGTDADWENRAKELRSES